MGLWLRCLRFIYKVIDYYCVYLQGGHCMFLLGLFAGWTGMETISLETGETATLPPVCRETTTTESEKFKSFVYLYWIKLIGSAKELLFHWIDINWLSTNAHVTLCNQMCFIYLSDIYLQCKKHSFYLNIYHNPVTTDWSYVKFYIN